MQARPLNRTMIRILLCLAVPFSGDLFAADSTPAIAPRGQAGSQPQQPPKPPIGCSRSDWLAGRCSGHPSTTPQPTYPPSYPDRDPYRRPVIINQTAPAVAEEAPTTDDWESCRRTKVNQLNAQQGGDQGRARQLDEWLWKNCRSYSEELRQLEQDRM